MKNSSVSAAKKGGKGVKRYSEKQVLKVMDWDQDHINAIKTYFRFCKEEGKEQAFYATDDMDLILQVENYFDQLVASGLSNCFLAIVGIPGADTMRIAERISNLMDEIRNEQLELFLADIREYRDCYSEEQLKNLEECFNFYGLSLN